VQSPSLFMDFGAFLFDEGSPVSLMLRATERARREVSLPVDSIVFVTSSAGVIYAFSASCTDAFATDVLSSLLLSPAKDGSGLVESFAAQKEVKLVSWRVRSVTSSKSSLEDLVCIVRGHLQRLCGSSLGSS